MTASDLVAVMKFSAGAVRVLQDFTGDRERLFATLNNLIAASEGFDDGSSDEADTGSAFGQDDGEFNIFNTDRQLSALQTAVKMLGA